jgi:ABC-2 type transport system permease protein
MFTTRPNHGSERLRKQPFLTQLLDLFLIELSNWRWGWLLMLLQGTVTPLFSLLGLGVFARDSGGEALAYVMSGNVVVGLLFGTMHAVQSHVTWMRFEGAMDYFATLPINRYVLILAMTLAFLLLSLPSLLITMLLGPFLLGVSLDPSPLILIVTPLCAASLAGVGALLGLVGRTRAESGNLGFLLTLVMTALGPVIVPPDRLPQAMLVLGHLVPTTYAASALRQTLVGPLTEQIIVDLVVLGGITVAFLGLVGRNISWRYD